MEKAILLIKGKVAEVMVNKGKLNAKRGYCLYKVGCKGPVTYNACGVTQWNNGVSFPIKSGHPCIGCSEAGFWDNGPFYRQLPDFPGFGIESNADKVGVGLAIATGVGIAAHDVATNIRKRKLIQDGNSWKTEKKSGRKSWINNTFSHE